MATGDRGGTSTSPAPFESLEARRMMSVGPIAPGSADAAAAALPTVGLPRVPQAPALSATFGIYGLASTGRGFWFGIPVMALWGLSQAAVQGLMSAKVAPTDQGKLQGAIGSLRGISGLIGPLLFTHVFAVFIAPHAPFALPGAPFVLAAGLLGFALLLAFALVPASGKSEAQSS